MTTWFKKAVILILCLEAIFFLAPRFLGFDPATILVSLLSDLTNQERQLENLPALKVSPVLSKAAELKAEDMAQKGYFAHTSPEGKTPWYWLDQAGYQYEYAGENLAVNFTNTEDVTAAWMKSPTHKANIEKSAYTEIGSAIATGTYKGKEAVFVVQIYANPRIEEIVKGSEQSTKQISIIPKTEGQVLGTSTQISSLNKEDLKADIIPAKSTSANKILLIILDVAIILLLLNIFMKFAGAYQNTFTNILLLVIFVIIIFLININFVSGGHEIYTGGIDYSKEQVK